MECGNAKAEIGAVVRNTNRICVPVDRVEPINQAINAISHPANIALYAVAANPAEVPWAATVVKTSCNDLSTTGVSASISPSMHAPIMRSEEHTSELQS